MELSMLASTPERASEAPQRGADRIAARVRIVRNVFALSMGQVLTWACTAGLAVFLPRFVDPDGVGKLATAASLTTLCGLLADLGITTYLTKEVGRRGRDARSEVLNALAMRVPMVLLASLVAVVAAQVLGYEPVTRRLIYLSCVGIGLAATGAVLVGTLQGLQQMVTVAISGVLYKALMLGLALLVVLWEFGLTGLVIAGLTAGAVGVIWNLVWLIRHRGLGGRVDVGTWRRILLGGLPFFVWQASLLIYGQVDVILLSVMTSDAVVGWYAAAYRIISIPVFIPTMVTGAVFPALAWTARHDVAEFRLLARRGLHIVLLLTMPMALGTMATADRIVELLAFPPEFRGSIPVIVVLAAHMPMVGVGMVVGHMLNACDRQRVWSVTGVAAAVLNPTIDSWLIPLFEDRFANGAIGSAIGTIVTELFMMVVGLWLVRGLLCNRELVVFALRCLVAGLAMVVVVSLLRDQPLPLTIAVGAATYFASTALVRALTLQDALLIRAYLLKRVGSAQAGA
jgi:O-antigen/teichoic acid export membrane protein